MEQEYKLSVFEIMQDPAPSGRTSEDGAPAGDTIRNLIFDNWDKYEKVSVYFDGVVQMTRTFCDEAFAKILEERTLEDLAAIDLRPGQRLIAGMMIENHADTAQAAPGGTPMLLQILLGLSGVTRQVNVCADAKGTLCGRRFELLTHPGCFVNRVKRRSTFHLADNGLHMHS